MFYKEQAEFLAKETNSPTIFWRRLHQLRSGHKNADTEFQTNKLMAYFKKLLYTTRPQDPIVSTPTGLDTWNAPIGVIETEKSLFKAKKGKAVGLDAVNLEIVLEFHKSHPDFLPYMFNSVLQSGKFPEAWSTALVVLIHKKGSKSDLSNYRGISLLSSLAKLFCSILNDRISTWAEENHILSDTQLGFRRGNRTSDALKIIHNLIDVYCHKKNTPVFGCFVDFKMDLGCDFTKKRPLIKFPATNSLTS